MEILPVIDLKNGLAVHARGGDRANYQPLKSRFADSSHPLALINGMNATMDLKTVYVADLDALDGGKVQIELLNELSDAFPQLRFVVDVGLKSGDEMAIGTAPENVDLVIASETLNSVDDYLALKSTLPDAHQILSLDRKGTECLGPTALFETADLWPESVIHMNLAHVGGVLGPDFDGLRALRKLAPRIILFAAGGVRNSDDLDRLSLSGVQGVLIGSALHDGRVLP